MIHPIKVMMSYGERVLGSFTLEGDISEHLKSGGDVQITVGGHDREKNWSGDLARIEVVKL